MFNFLPNTTLIRKRNIENLESFAIKFEKFRKILRFFKNKLKILKIPKNFWKNTKSEKFQNFWKNPKNGKLSKIFIFFEKKNWKFRNVKKFLTNQKTRKIREFLKKKSNNTKIFEKCPKKSEKMHISSDFLKN